MTRRRTWKKLWFWKGPMTWRSRQRETAVSDTLFCTTAALWVWGFCCLLGTFSLLSWIRKNLHKEVIKMQQDFIMNCRNNWSKGGFAIILASHKRSLHYLDAVCKFLLSEHAEIHILAFSISWYLFRYEWNYTNWWDDHKLCKNIESSTVEENHWYCELEMKTLPKVSWWSQKPESSGFFMFKSSSSQDQHSGKYS